MKTRSRLMLAALFLLGVALIAFGVGSAVYGRSSIEDARTATGTVTQLSKRTQRDLDGTVSLDWVTADFVTADGKTATVKVEVFSKAFLATGVPVTVWYDPRDPSRGA